MKKWEGQKLDLNVPREEWEGVLKFEPITGLSFTSDLDTPSIDTAKSTLVATSAVNLSDGTIYSQYYSSEAKGYAIKYQKDTPKVLLGIATSA